MVLGLHEIYSTSVFWWRNMLCDRGEHVKGDVCDVALDHGLTHLSIREL